MHFSCISHAYLRHILRHTLGTSQSYLIYLRNMSYKCWQILGIYLTYLMLISAISKANLREILENLRYIWSISKAYLSNIIWFLEDGRRESCWPHALRLDIEETMAEKEESEADVQFVEEGILVMEAERTLSSRFSNININHDMCTRTKVVIYLSFSRAIIIATQLKSRCN